MRSATESLDRDPWQAQPGEPLLMQATRGGRRLAAAPDLPDIRRHAAENLARLPEPLRRLQEFAYRVEIAPVLHELAAQVDHSSFLDAPEMSRLNPAQ